MKRIIKVCIGFGIALSCAVSTYAATGFIDTPIWFTPESPSDGDTVTVYAVFKNTEKVPLNGTVLFYDNELLLGKKQLSIASNNVSLASVSFKIGPGEHAFSAQMSNLTEIGEGGKTVPVALPVTSAKATNYFVSKTIPNPFSAQAGSDSTASEKLLLNQVDEIQKKVLDSVPDTVKDTVSEKTKSLDSWRNVTAESFSTKKSTAEKSLDTLTKQKAEALKKGSIAPSAKYVDTPLAYVRLWLFSMLAFLFGTPVMFYIVGLLLVFFVLRFLFSKIVKFIRRKRGKIDAD